MKFFETLLLLCEFGLIIFLLTGKSKDSRHTTKLLLVPIALILLHLLIEGFRWQLGPAYLIGLVLAFVALKSSRTNKSHTPNSRWKNIGRISAAVLGILLLCLSAALAYLIPAVTLPAPTGKYRVGTRAMHLIDTSRDEIITLDPHDKRELMVKVWYPTEVGSGEEEPYLSDLERSGFTSSNNAPDFFLSHLGLVNSHTLLAPEMAGGRFPVLVFSHGYMSLSDNYYAFLPELVSHGYIIVHISHTYENIVTEFPDGKVLYNCDSFSIANNQNEDMWQVVEKMKNDLKIAQNGQDSIEAVRNLMHKYSGSNITRRWVTDISFVIDRLFEMNESSEHFLHAKMNLEQLGAFGHSLGGAAAAQASIFDSRIRAASNWDGTQFGDVIDTVFHKPFMMLNQFPFSEDHNPNDQVFHRKSLSSFYDIKINGTGHSNFQDIPIWIRLNQLTTAGEIDPARGAEIINRLTLAFFDKHLRNKPISITDFENEIEELDISIYEGGTLAEKE